MRDYIRKDDLVKILRTLSKTYDEDNRWQADSLTCVGICAKRDLCDDLADMLSLPQSKEKRNA